MLNNIFCRWGYLTETADGVSLLRTAESTTLGVWKQLQDYLQHRNEQTTNWDGCGENCSSWSTHGWMFVPNLGEKRAWTPLSRLPGTSLETVAPPVRMESHRFHVCVLHVLTSFEIRVLTAMKITGIDATQLTLVENQAHCLYSFQSIHSRCGTSRLSVMNNPLRPEHHDRGENHRSLCQFPPKWHIDSMQN